MWQGFLILGLIICAGEIFAPGVVMLPIGVAAIATSPFTLFLPEWAILIVWALLSLLFMKGMRKFFNRKEKDAYKSGADSLVGQRAKVVEAIDPEKGTGAVKIYGVEYKVAQAEGKADKDSMVEITGFTGNRVNVKL